nr:MAG TPA: hypothetical protein [Caudoviricetes sp.]
MSNTSLILESLALIKDAKDRLDKTDPSKLSAIDAFHAAVARYWLASSHEQLEDLLHKLPGGEA